MVTRYIREFFEAERVFSNIPEFFFYFCHFILMSVNAVLAFMGINFVIISEWPSLFHRLLWFW